MTCFGKHHQISKDDLVESLQQLAKQLGRTPTQRESTHHDACSKQFGNWNNAILAAGLKPNRSLNQRMYKRRTCLAKDGHMCDSISELIIDNWLHKNNIHHTKSAPYPQGKFTTDWKIGAHIFVEYFGLANDSKRYDIAIKRKRIICRQAGLKLIEIYSKDIFPKNKLEKVFQTLLI